MWALVEDWEAVDGLSDSLEKTLQAVSSHLPNKVVQTAAGTTEWIFLTALKVNMDSALHDAAQVHELQREQLQQCIHTHWTKRCVALMNPGPRSVK